MLERGHDVDKQVIVGAVLVGGRESSEIPVSRGAQFVLDTRGSVAREGAQAGGRRRRGRGGRGGEGSGGGGGRGRRGRRRRRRRRRSGLAGRRCSP